MFSLFPAVRWVSFDIAVFTCYENLARIVRWWTHWALCLVWTRRRSSREITRELWIAAQTTVNGRLLFWLTSVCQVAPFTSSHSLTFLCISARVVDVEGFFFLKEVCTLRRLVWSAYHSCSQVCGGARGSGWSVSVMGMCVCVCV